MFKEFFLRLHYHLLYWILIWLLLVGIIWQRSHIEKFHDEEPVRLRNF